MESWWTDDKAVHLQLSNDEALVLFEWLSHFLADKNGATHEDLEQRVLCDVQCLLEKSLLEPFLPDYPELLARARARVRDESD